MIDKPIGRIFKLNGKKYVAVSICTSCAFRDGDCICKVACKGSERKDGIDVIYKEVIEEDVATLLTELNDIVAEFNKLIRENNAIVAASLKADRMHR